VSAGLYFQMILLRIQILFQTYIRLQINVMIRVRPITVISPKNGAIERRMIKPSLQYFYRSCYFSISLFEVQLLHRKGKMT